MRPAHLLGHCRGKIDKVGDSYAHILYASALDLTAVYDFQNQSMLSPSAKGLISGVGIILAIMPRIVVQFFTIELQPLQSDGNRGTVQ